jgi:hypothetical protein
LIQATDFRIAGWPGGSPAAFSAVTADQVP